jgi:ABC-type antimicrobial peptide transport system permease subunit
MIGVITYISVLERQKEIGILRAIGASRHNISQVFNAETFITGALAGILGIGITLAALPPINALIHSLTGQNNINAALPLPSAGALILLSIVLTLIGGIIPSMKAAKSDPVAALRSE